MKAEKYLDLERKIDNVSGLFSLAGDFGIIDGKNQIDKLVKTEKGYSYQNDTVKLDAEFTHFENGAILRKDTLTNLSDHPIVLRRAFHGLHSKVRAMRSIRNTATGNTKAQALGAR